jgi:hypothetical protein
VCVGTTYQCYRDTGPFDTVANQYVYQLSHTHILASSLSSFPQSFCTHVYSCRGLPIDPLAEVRKIRTSINSIEQSIRYTQSQGTEGVVKSNQYLPPGSPGMSNLNVDKTLTTHIFDDGRGITTTPGSGPGAHGRQVGGFYTGPTSASSHLISAGPMPLLHGSLAHESDSLMGKTSIHYRRLYRPWTRTLTQIYSALSQSRT